MKKNLTELVFILDRSGSMAGLEADTIGGFNSLIAKQKKEEGDAYISTVLFDDTSEVLHDRVKLSEIKFVYGSKKWDTASTRDLFNFISWIGGGKTVASLEDYINAAWDYAFTCNKYAGQRARKWDIIHL